MPIKKLGKKPSRLQRNTAKIAIENPTMPKGELVELGGYGVSVQRTPGKALESKGYLEALAEYGLTDELITTSLVSDIKAKAKNRVSELRLGADIRQLTKREEKPSGGQLPNLIQIIINSPNEK